MKIKLKFLPKRWSRCLLFMICEELLQNLLDPGNVFVTGRKGSSSILYVQRAIHRFKYKKLKFP